MEAGDKVKIRTVKEVLEGILLESHEPGIVLIKLKSGYNIGIKKEDITDSEVLEKKQEKEEKFELKSKDNLLNVDMIVTGGTIAARLDYKTGGVNWLTKPEQLLKFYPEMTGIVNVRKIEVPFMKSSEAMDSRDWIEIAKACEKSLNNKDVSGVIVTHGTDFLHYTAAALSFFLQNLNKPLVLTYSQRSSDRASSDARLNLQCASQASISEIAEVMLVGHANNEDNFCNALLGSKVRKMHTSRRDAFKPINTKPLARVYPDRLEISSSFRRRNNAEKVKLDAVFNDKVALIKFYPGQNPDILDYYAQHYEGIVIEVGGLGHLPPSESRNNWIPKIKKAIDNGLVICAAAQTISGRLNPMVYSNGRELLKAGVIFLEDMLPETALVKLGWVLGHKNWKSQIKEKMLENFSGELNKRLLE